MGDLLPGQLGYTFLVAILDAALLSWLALVWYGRSVRRLMRGTRTADAVAVPTRGAPREADASAFQAVPATLTFAIYDAAVGRGGDSSPASPEGSEFRRVVFAYCLGASLYSVVVTAAKLSGDGASMPFVAWFAEWWANAWPIVPTLAALLVLDRRGTIGMAGAFVAIGALALTLLTLVGQVARGAFTTAPVTNAYYLILGLALTASAPLVLVLLTGWRRVRAVMPLALASTLLFGFGSMAFREALVRAFNHSAARTVLLKLAVITNTNVSYYGLFMIVALPIGWLAWQLLKGVARGYAHKQFSNVQLVVDCWWVVATSEVVSTDLAASWGLASLAIGALAFAAYRLGVALALRGAFRAGVQDAPRLLLLRVFGYQARTEALFDRVAEHWRFRGPVRLIAGVDLATRTADAGDILAFLSGRLGRQYIAAADEIPARVSALDGRRDPDGRFRVSELFCHDDTWRPSLRSLLDTSDTVLMDLRSFTRQNAGCIFELEQIVSCMPTDRIVLVYDGTTDLRLLGDTLDAAWAEARREGRARGNGQLAVVHVERRSRRELGVLMQRLCGVGGPSRLVSAAQLPGV